MNNENKWKKFSIMLRRKIVTATLSSLLFALIFSLFGGFEGDGFYILYYLNFMFAITYGVITSFISDWISRQLSEKNNIREIISFLFHCGSGVVFLIFGLCSAVIFFIVDRLLKKVKIGWLSVVIVLLMVVIAFIILINR